MVREFNDKVMELILSRPIPRSSYFFGKLAGYAMVALTLALLFSLPLAFFAPAARVALWGLSLACELLIVTAVSLFCVLSLTQVISALAAVTGFYVLARAIGALQVIAANPLADSVVLSQQFFNLAVDAIAFLLPGLDRMTQTGWLIYSAPTATEIAGVAAQTVVYLLFLCGAALFDLQRKNF
jgi:ABC-type Na+ efflux pump permease subunit